MAIPIAELVGFDVICPKCSKATQKKIAWLIARDEMDCPGCGARIGFKGTEIGACIKQLYDACAQLDIGTAQKIR